MRPPSKGYLERDDLFAARCQGRQDVLSCADGKTVTEGVSLDEIVGKERVTYIKMDVEGAEKRPFWVVRKASIRGIPRCSLLATIMMMTCGACPYPFGSWYRSIVSISAATLMCRAGKSISSALYKS